VTWLRIEIKYTVPFHFDNDRKSGSVRYCRSCGIQQIKTAVDSIPCTLDIDSAARTSAKKQGFGG
jgi:hypothetical protein